MNYVGKQGTDPMLFLLIGGAGSTPQYVVLISITF